MFGLCLECKDKGDDWFENFTSEVLNNQISWNQWERIEADSTEVHSRRKSKKNYQSGQSCKKRIEKRYLNGTIGDAIERLAEKIPNFLVHTFIKRAQSNHFQFKILNIPPSSAVVQVDFSENYSLQDQGEVQSAHWNEEQLTLFTVCVWMHQKQKSFVFVSNDLDHDKTSVIVFMNKLLSMLSIDHGVINFDIFSDGPSSQFKNQYVFNYLPQLCERNSIGRLAWHFFATSHGKGAVDGIGGTVKRNVWMATLARKVIVRSLHDFCAVASELSHKVEIIKMTAAEIAAEADKLRLAEFFAKSSAIKEIKKQHYVAVAHDGKILCKQYSSQPEQEDLECSRSLVEMEMADDWYEDHCQQLAPVASFKEGDYVMFAYEGENFPGMITFVHPKENGVRIKSMERCAGGWRWPRSDDEIDYNLGDIIKVIGFPVPVNNRGTFKVDELLENWGH